MGFKYCADQLAITIKLLDNYDDTNVTFNDYRVLQRGITKAVVLRRGSFSRARTEFRGGRETVWNIITELFIKYKDDVQAQNDIRDESQDIMDKVDQYPLLGSAGTSTIYHAYITSGAEPVPVFSEDGRGPHFFMQELQASIIEHTIVTELE